MGTHADPGILPRTLEIIFGSLKSKIDGTMPIQKPTKFDGVEEVTIEEIDQLEHLKSTLISKVGVPAGTPRRESQRAIS